MVQELSALAGVPFEDMLVHNVQEANIKGRDCLIASLWMTGENGTWGVHVYEPALSQLDVLYLYKFVYICFIYIYIGGCEYLVAFIRNIYRMYTDKPIAPCS